MKKDKYVYFKCGSNILRIIRDILECDSIDYVNYLEVQVADGHGRYHFEKNRVSACIAEDYDVKKLDIIDNPLKTRSVIVRVSPKERVKLDMPSSDLTQVKAKRIMFYKNTSKNKKRTAKIESKDVNYAY